MFSVEPVIKHRYWAFSLKEKRESMGYSLRELAEKVGVSASFLSKVENKRQFVNEKQADAIKKALK